MRRATKSAGLIILHLSFIVMIAGGLLTRLTKTEGRVRISPGETATEFIDRDGTRHRLPEAVTLRDFEIQYYPGGVVPRDYISHLIIGGRETTVSMNNILDIRGYRLLQFSYDETGATVLSVNHDPYGIPLAYGGFALFALGGLMCLLSPKGRFRSLLRKAAAAAVIAMAFSGNASAATIEGISRASADSLRSRQVLYNGRIVTFNTLARDVMMKLHGSAAYRGLSPEQTLLSLKMYPDRWKEQPLILIKEKGVSEALGIEGKYARLTDVFDSVGNYRVERLYFTLDADRRRGVEDLDEKVGIILTLLSGDLITMRPADMPALSDTHVKIELLYNALPLTKIIFILLFSGFLAGMALWLISPQNPQIISILRRAPLILLAAATIVSAANFGAQWYLSSRLPLANTFETLEFVVICFEAILVLLGRKNGLLLTLGLLMAGALALVAHLVASNPVVTQLMPVLHSGWLSLHVSLVMTSYAIFGFSFLIAVTGLLFPSCAGKMRTLAACILHPGVYLLGLGICTGAIWANISWGEYWSWDPKETWALVTFLIYAIPLHPKIKFLRKTRVFLIYLLFAILSVAMTYFGVNYLDSLHAYN